MLLVDSSVLFPGGGGRLLISLELLVEVDGCGMDSIWYGAGPLELLAEEDVSKLVCVEPVAKVLISVVVVVIEAVKEGTSGAVSINTGGSSVRETLGAKVEVKELVRGTSHGCGPQAQLYQTV